MARKGVSSAERKRRTLTGDRHDARATGRGFGIPATPDLGAARALARAAEGFGYRGVWTNDPPGIDGLLVARAMAEATSTIRIGVGAVPCDRRSPAEVAARLESLELPLHRLTLIVGAGFSDRPLRAVADAIAHLRDRKGDVLTLGIAAMGPGMCRLGGRLGDAVLLNWMTPERVRWARPRIEQGAADRDPRLAPVEVMAYVRAAIGPQASQLIAGEAGRYLSMPHYRKHFRAMGGEPSSVGVVLDDDRLAAEAQIHRYEELLDETVLRAVVAPSPQSGSALLEVARAAAPKSPAR